MVSRWYVPAPACAFAGQASTRSPGPAAASCPPEGCPPAWAAPGRQPSADAPAAVHGAPPVTGPLASVPSGRYQYPTAWVSTIVAEPAIPPGAETPASPGTCDHMSRPAGEEYRKNLV